MTNKDPGEIETPSDNSLERRVGAGSLWIAAEMVGVQGLSILVFSVLAHFITPREFGLMSLSFLLIFSLRWVLSENIAYAIIRKATATDLEYTTAFWLTLGMSFVGFVVIEAASLVVGPIFHSPDIGPILRAMGVILIFMGLSRTHEAWMTRHFHFRSLAVRSLMGSIVGGLVGIGCAVLHLGVWALILQQVTMAVVSLVALWLATPWRPAFAFCWKTMREILEYVGSATANSAVSVFNDVTDTALVAIFFGPFNVGLYSIAKRLRLAMQMVASTPVTGASLPALAEAQHDSPRFQALILNLTGVLLAVSCPAFIGAAMVSHDLIPIVFGNKWTPAASIFSGLSIAGLFYLLVNFFGIVFIVTKQQTWNLYLSLLYTAIMSASFVFLHNIKSIQLTIPFLLPYAIILPVGLARFLHVSGIQFRVWLIAARGPVLASSCMAALVWFTDAQLKDASSLVRLSSNIVIGITSYGIAMRIFDHKMFVYFEQMTFSTWLKFNKFILKTR